MAKFFVMHERQQVSRSPLFTDDFNGKDAAAAIKLMGEGNQASQSD